MGDNRLVAASWILGFISLLDNCTSNAILLPNNNGAGSLQQSFYLNLITVPNVKESLFSTQFDFEHLIVLTCLSSYHFPAPTF